MSPERLNCLPYGVQADQWSLGCILYALLTGKLPIEFEQGEDIYDFKNKLK